MHARPGGRRPLHQDAGRPAAWKKWAGARPAQSRPVGAAAAAAQDHASRAHRAASARALALYVRQTAGRLDAARVRRRRLEGRAGGIRHVARRAPSCARSGTRPTSGCGGILSCRRRCRPAWNSTFSTTRTWRFTSTASGRRLKSGFTTAYVPLEIAPAALALLQPGARITLAAHCHQTTGGQDVDIGLAEVDLGL